MLRGRPENILCREMLDWDAPTGGTLLPLVATGGMAGERAVQFVSHC